MKAKIKLGIMFWVVMAGLLLPLKSGLAQDEASLRLSLLRNFGSSLGGSIAGTFTYRVSGPDDLLRVVFLMDGEPIGEDSEAPFRLQFNTGRYALGPHTMGAVGYTVDGRELQSNVIQREFISNQESSRYLFWILIPILVLAVGGRLFSSWAANRGSGEPAVSGPLGGAVCPQCGRPFALHIWGFNLVMGKYDRCPHCGKWSLVRRASPQQLQAAAFDAEQDTDTAVSLTPPDSFAKKLEDSRFNDTD